jgi:hypothetical protein
MSRYADWKLLFNKIIKNSIFAIPIEVTAAKNIKRKILSMGW